ncbi:MAG: ATP-dependent zinc metalloprotease FtsH [Oscillospiraceae bacterium]|nr:ATP-dependent zinc metalloprotease FtsH [Oscillospiraceae bacterium]
MVLKDGSTVTAKLYSGEMFYDEFNDILVAQKRAGILTDYNYLPDTILPWYASFLPWLVILGLFALLWYSMMSRQMNAGGGGGGAGDRPSRFSRARTKVANGEGKQVTFADVAGADEEKAELQEVVDFLKEPQRYLELGARIPKGILLVGPPGTGKTLLAKAVAGEAGVNFLSISGSDFVELYVGVGAGRVRDLFDQAKKDAPAIVFIDEIDAVARQRGAGLGGGHDEREQTLNQLLVEMDGFTANEGVVVLAATNRVDILDPAILRPGRFDRQVYVGEPDVKGREDILKVHTRNKPLADDVDLKTVAKSTAGFTGAELESLMNEAALRAAKFRRPFILMEDIEESIIKVLAGPEKKSKVVIERERKLTAYHEAGHALVLHALPSQDPVHQITIVPRGMAGGMTIHLPKEDKSFQSKKELTDRIAVCLGGRCAEQLVLGDISTGAGSDLQTASAIARNMVMRYGMSDKLGNVVFDSGHDEVFIGRSMAQAKSYSEETASLIDEEVKRLLDDAYRTCGAILTRDRAYLEKVAQYLLEHETMDGETFERIMNQPV